MGLGQAVPHARAGYDLDKLFLLSEPVSSSIKGDNNRFNFIRLL